MEIYRVLWLSVCVPLGAIGAAVGLVVSPAAVVFLRIAAGAVGSVTLCLFDAYWGRSTTGRLRLLAGGALVGGTGGGAFVGIASLLGPGVLLLAAVVLAGSPYAVKVSGRWLRSLRTPSTAQLDAVARAFAYASPEYAQFRAPVRDLTDEQRCKRWRASYRASQRQQSSAVKLIAGVAERQMYLEELERRNSSGFAAWLAAGAEAAEDPLPYLNGDRVDAPAVDWDELTRGQG
jgi:MFS family permease